MQKKERWIPVISFWRQKKTTRNGITNYYNAQIYTKQELHRIISEIINKIDLYGEHARIVLYPLFHKRTGKYYSMMNKPPDIGLFILEDKGYKKELTKTENLNIDQINAVFDEALKNK